VGGVGGAGRVWAGRGWRGGGGDGGGVVGEGGPTPIRRALSIMTRSFSTTGIDTGFLPRSRKETGCLQAQTKSICRGFVDE